MPSQCLDTSWIWNKYAKQRGVGASLSTFSLRFVKKTTKSNKKPSNSLIVFCTVASITKLKFDLVLLKIPHESIRHLQRLSLSATISLREVGREALARLFGYATMILDHILPRQCSSLVNWISWWRESHASRHSGVTGSIRRWWAPDMAWVILSSLSLLTAWRDVEAETIGVGCCWCDSGSH